MSDCHLIDHDLVANYGKADERGWLSSCTLGASSQQAPWSPVDKCRA